MQRGFSSPISALKDLKQDFKDEHRADYAAGTPSRFRRRRNGLYGSGDSHYASEIKFVMTREYSRDMDRNDAVFGMFIDRAVEQQVQLGFMLKPDTGDTGADKALAALWEDWRSDPLQCDRQGERAFPEIEALVTRAEFVDGDIFANLTDDGCIQLVEAHRCRTPSQTPKMYSDKTRVVQGVRIDQYRKPTEFWFCPDNLNPFDRFEKVGDATRFPAWDDDGLRRVCQIYSPARVSQTRGVVAFHAIFDLLGMFEDTNFSLFVKQQMASMLTWFLRRTGDYGGDLQTGDRRQVPLTDGTEATLEGMAPGSFVRGKKGEELEMKSPTIPSTETMAHLEYMSRIIGGNIGLPLGLAMMQPEGNFSAWRGVMEQAKVGFRKNQRRRITQFYRPVYLWKVSQWLEQDPALRTLAAKTGIKIAGHEWKTPGWPYIQPLHDAQADSLKITNLLASPTMVHAEDGRVYGNVRDECIRDSGSAIEAAIIEAKRITDTHNVAVTWKDVLHRDEPKGSQVIETVGDEDETTTAKKGKKKAAA